MVQVRHSGGRFTPDRQGIDRQGKATFVVPLCRLLALVTELIVYALTPAWTRALDWPIPDAARWVGLTFSLARVPLARWAWVTLGRHWSA